VQKLISIIIPSYNRPYNLDFLLTSLMTVDEDFLNQIEVIVSDDSTEPEAIVAVCEKYPFVKYIKNLATVHGPGTNRKNGLNNATGKWVMFMDDDDSFHPNFNYIKDYLLNADEDIIMLRTKWFEWEEDNSLWICNHCSITLNMITHGKIYRKSFIDEHNITYSDEYRYNEDAYFNFQFYPYIYGSKTHKELVLDFSFYKFLNNRTSISRRIDEEGDAFDKAIKNNTYSWFDSYFFNTIPTLETFTQEERQNYYKFILPVFVYMVRNMNWIEETEGFSQEQLAIYIKFFEEWRRLFNDETILENHYCIEEFYLEKRLYLIDKDFFNVIDRVHEKHVY
jgi:glycosyltransferase involved in cell wall biosynthesis